ncbi:MAG: selenocysteine-specific translation elongation factor [Armatimonas sp.]
MCASTFVVGTAGHVDHGKSSLVRALTGTDPDRLVEEQLRQMTIDLGFAELTSPAGNRIHLVDVPGHERFVRNMLAGAGGIDAAILTIAADDGPMPQSREHLAILDLLGIERGVVALSKADLVDSEWTGFIAESIRELLDGTALEDTEIVPISSLTGQGLPKLLAALDRVLAPIERHRAGSFPRLPIDRVFTMPGFGTVVTGTLLDAPLKVGDRVSIQPNGLTSRVRGLQSFSESVEVALPGSRVAVNLTGLETSELHRGDVLTPPDAMRPAMRLDTRTTLLASSERPLRHNDDVILFTGSSETLAKAALLDTESLEPGRSGWVQLRLSRPVAVQTGDRFVLRRPSPSETIGGGLVIELDPPRHKRFQPAIIARLEQLAAGDPADVAIAWIGSRYVTERELAAQTTSEIVTRLIENRHLQRIGPFVATTNTFEWDSARMSALVDGFHAGNPLVPGIGREALRQELDLPRTVFDAVLARIDGLEDVDSMVRRTGFRIVLDPPREEIAQRYLDRIRQQGFQPTTPDEAGLPLDLGERHDRIAANRAGRGGHRLPPGNHRGRAYCVARCCTAAGIDIAGGIPRSVGCDPKIHPGAFGILRPATDYAPGG